MLGKVMEEPNINAGLRLSRLTKGLSSAPHIPLKVCQSLGSNDSPSKLISYV